MPVSEAHLDQLASQIGSGKLKFKIQTGGKKYECKLIDRATHEKEKAARDKAAAEAGETSAGSSEGASSSASSTNEASH